MKEEKRKKEGFNSFFNKTFVKCPKCGYNNEEKRFQFFGTCLRCNFIIDKKLYIKRRLYLSNIKERKKYEKGERAKVYKGDF